jgi:hypothetical protein
MWQTGFKPAGQYPAVNRFIIHRIFAANNLPTHQSVKIGMIQH